MKSISKRQIELNNLHEQLKRDGFIKLYLIKLSSHFNSYKHYTDNLIALKFIELIAKPNNYIIEYGNDAPRGGKLGNYVIIKK